MRILVVGATRTIGEAIVDALKNGNEIVPVSHRSTPITVDLASVPSIRTMLDKVGKVDAIVCAAGNAKFVPMEQLSDDDFDFSLRNKLMGQVNLIRYGLAHVGIYDIVTLPEARGQGVGAAVTARRFSTRVKPAQELPRSSRPIWASACTTPSASGKSAKWSSTIGVLSPEP